MESSKCRTCRFDGGIAPMSGHHRVCTWPDGAYYYRTAALALHAQVAGKATELPVLRIRANDEAKTPVIELQTHGIKEGWCYWPLNYDPVWVHTCHAWQPMEAKS